jgi:hypothetical protein
MHNICPEVGHPLDVVSRVGADVAQRIDRAIRGVIVLSHDDRRRLREIERRLYDDDPRLAHRFDAWSTSRDWRWLAVLLVVVGIGGTVAGTLALSDATIVLLGFVPIASGIALWYVGES